MIKTKLFRVLCLVLILAAAPACETACKPEEAILPKGEGLYKLDPGPYTIQVKNTLVLHDDIRDKDLQIRITYPEEKGMFPVIIWSHGLGGNKDNSQPIVHHWAGHGYVCIQMNHTDSLQLTRNPGTRDWRNRPLDISFVINSLDDIEKELETLKGKMHKVTIGMGGHSFGAHTTQLVGGATTRHLAGNKHESHADERPLAFIMISPQGTGGLLDEDSWNSFTRPAMMVTGSNDTSPTSGKPYTWRLEVFQYLPPGNKYLLFIEGAYHDFGGITGATWQGSGPENPEHVNYVKSTTIAFWDAYLKMDDSAKAYLNSDRLSQATNGNASITAK